MKKDKKWFIDKWTKERDKTDVHDPMYHFINEFIADVRLLDEPEVLSHDWISENVEYAYFDMLDDSGRLSSATAIIKPKKLQNLIIPKQEITEEQVMNWLDNNEFYDHITAETVLERAVDKGELSYYGTKYSVIEAPTIPKYVADWIEEERGTMSNWKLPSRFISDSKYKKDQRRYKWSQVEGNMDKFMSALINGYEVEEEPKYHALIKGHELVDDYDIYWNYNKSDHDVFVSRLHPPLDNFSTEMTKAEWNKLGINDSNADFVKVDEELN